MDVHVAEEAPESKELKLSVVLIFLPVALALLQFFTAYGDSLGSFLPTCNVLAWVLPAYLYAQFLKRDPLIEFGVLTPPRLSGWVEMGLLSFVGLPMYVLIVHFGIVRIQHDPWDIALWGRFLIHQLFFVALAEEFYFRGVLQPALEKRLPKYPALIVGALLFALAHVAADQHFLRMLVFFPGLLFGWLKMRSGSIVPSVLFHAFSNLVYLFLPLHEVL
ncbi:MAG: type II CAAX endopeptidase family protein [Planctomycetota bacterium]|nr:type II CAAX endopeptidase family protein [Planctomycetota bacterium]